uniref:Trypanosoma vivax n=1 Tax=Trypanosoma vivax (strain Y486) TaxID=1055687 RepID=G0UAB9_TRYVY|nr:Trypanosoma vivax [Trypanosoma vivax Y486]
MEVRRSFPSFPFPPLCLCICASCCRCRCHCHPLQRLKTHAYPHRCCFRCYLQQQESFEDVCGGGGVAAFKCRKKQERCMQHLGHKLQRISPYFTVQRRRATLGRSHIVMLKPFIIVTAIIRLSFFLSFVCSLL